NSKSSPKIPPLPLHVGGVRVVSITVPVAVTRVFGFYTVEHESHVADQVLAAEASRKVDHLFLGKIRFYHVQHHIGIFHEVQRVAYEHYWRGIEHYIVVSRFKVGDEVVELLHVEQVIRVRRDLTAEEHVEIVIDARRDDVAFSAFLIGYEVIG